MRLYLGAARPFDSLEVGAVIMLDADGKELSTYNDPKGVAFESCDDDDPHAVAFVLYGRREGQGVQSLADFPTMAQALNARQALEAALPEHRPEESRRNGAQVEHDARRHFWSEVEDTCQVAHAEEGSTCGPKSHEFLNEALEHLINVAQRADHSGLLASLHRCPMAHR